MISSPKSFAFGFCGFFIIIPAFLLAADSAEWRVTSNYVGQTLSPFAGLPGIQKSRVSDDQEAAFGRDSFLTWEVDVEGVSPQVRDQVLPILQAKLAWSVKRNVEGNPITDIKDQTLAEHLTHGSVSSGDWAQYKKRVYIARLRIVDELGNHREIERKLIAELETAKPIVAAGLAAIVKNGATIIIRAKRGSPEPNQTPWYSTSWGGDQKEVVLPKKWRIIAIGHGKNLDTIWIRYRQPNGEIHQIRFGGDNEPSEMFELQDGESIVRVTGKAGGRVEKLQFHTDHGRSSPEFGENRGSAVIDSRAPSGWELVGMRVRSGDRLDKIRFVWRPKH